MLPNEKTTRTMIVIAAAMLIGITVGHYATNTHDIAFHNVYRRLYYVPVVLGAFALGLRGGLGAALIASLAYIPHAFLMGHHHRDPAPTLDKVFEIALYLIVGALTGWLVERERRARAALEQTLSERAELEQQLVRAGKLGALGELLAGVAHEIRNPMAAIMGAAEALERSFSADERGHRLVALQLRELGRLERVVSNFLTFARAGEPSRDVVGLAPLVEQIVELARHQPDDALANEFIFDPSVRGARVLVDADQASQVLLNLTLNALQASAGAPCVVTYLYKQVDVAGRRHDVVGVRDDGPGIAQEKIEQIFDPFFTTRPSGSGLGLSLSSRIAQAHGGFIDVESRPGETTFWLHLPTPDEASDD